MNNQQQEKKEKEEEKEKKGLSFRDILVISLVLNKSLTQDFLQPEEKKEVKQIHGKVLNLIKEVSERERALKKTKPEH